MVGIFISYRRDDSGDMTDRFYDCLLKYYKKNYIFKDVDTLDGGDNFEEIIVNSIKSSKIFILIIGKDWLEIRDENGNQRIKNLEDYVRFEIETALQNNIRILPILVGGAKIPRKSELPNSIQSIASINAINLRRNPDFSNDIKKLLSVILNFTDKEGRVSFFQTRKVTAITIAVVIIILLSYFSLQMCTPLKSFENQKVELAPLVSYEYSEPSSAKYKVKLYSFNTITNLNLIKEGIKKDSCICYIEQGFNGFDNPETGWAAAYASVNASSYTINWGTWYVKAISRGFSVRIHPDEVIKIKHSVLRDLEIPALVVEPLFMTNPNHLNWIRNYKGQHRLALILAESIWRFFPTGGKVCMSTGRHEGVLATDGGSEKAFSQIVIMKAKEILENPPK